LLIGKKCILSSWGRLAWYKVPMRGAARRDSKVFQRPDKRGRLRPEGYRLPEEMLADLARYPYGRVLKAFP
jgi:hypothetical protein